MSDFTEAEIRASLDGTFTSIGGRRVVVPRDFVPSHENTHIAAGRGWMTETKARAILQHIRAGATQRETAQRFNVSHSTVSDISRGRTWKRLQEVPHAQ